MRGLRARVAAASTAGGDGEEKLMPMKYTAGKLRAWHRGHRARRLGKPCVCYSDNPDYVAAWRNGWLAAGVPQAERAGMAEEEKVKFE